MPNFGPRDLNQTAIMDLIGYNLRRASNAMIRDFVEAMAGCGLGPAQFAIMSLIADNPGRKQSEIARVLGIKRANFIPLFDALEAGGLVRRAPSPTDRRSYSLHLTDKGQDLMIEARARVTRHEEKFAALMTAEERALFLTFLKRLWSSGG